MMVGGLRLEEGYCLMICLSGGVEDQLLLLMFFFWML
jgi:hypothetical protein